MALMSYLTRDRLGTYYFRRVIPPALRPFMPPPWVGKREWKRSLRTKDPKEAKLRGSRLLADCTADLEVAERAERGEPVPKRPSLMLTPEQLERDEIARRLAEDEAVRRGEADGRRHHQTPEERAQWDHLPSVKPNARHMERDYSIGYREELEMMSEDFREAYSRLDPSIVAAELGSLLRERGQTLNPDSEAYHELAIALLRGRVKAYDMMLARQDGAIVPTPIKSFGLGPAVSEAFAEWREGSGLRGGRKPSANTVREAEHAVRRFKELHGDIELGAITRALAVEFRGAMGRLPTHLPHKLRALPLPELLRRDLKAYPPAHTATVNKALTLLSTIFRHAENAGKLDAVPGYKHPFGAGIKLDVDARTATDRELFDAADLTAIFSSGVYQHGERPEGGGGEAAFWLPLLALFTGARLGELAQLRVGDLVEDRETGVFYIDIYQEGERSIKNASSRRKVPVHPELIRIGLLRYRQGLLDGGATAHSPLWPNVGVDRAGRAGGAWSKWINRYIRKAGITAPSKVFHSFRHTFKRNARNAGILKEMHDALTGHSGGGDVGQSYGRGFGLKVLAAAMEKVEVPGCVAALLWEAPGPARGERSARRSRGSHASRA